MNADFETLCSNLEKTGAPLKEFSDFLDNTGKTPYKEFDYPLFHYTNSSALEGILFSRALWFTNIFTQKSDPFEIRSGMDICYQLLDDHLPKVTYSGAKIFIEKFKKILQDNIEQSGQFFLFCTSRIEDDPHQWIEFADDGKGICLEFTPEFAKNFSNTKEDDDGCCSNGSSPVFEVYYDDKKLRDALSPIIQTCMDSVDKGLKAANPDKNEGWLFLRLITVLLAVNCLPHCTEYKPTKFSKENEIRFLRIVRADRTPRYLRTKKIGDETRVFLELPLQKGDLKAIWLGPQTPATMQTWLKEKLSENGWDAVEIKQSKTPFA